MSTDCQNTNNKGPTKAHNPRSDHKRSLTNVECNYSEKFIKSHDQQCRENDGDKGGQREVEIEVLEGQEAECPAERKTRVCSNSTEAVESGHVSGTRATTIYQIMATLQDLDHSHSYPTI